MAKILVKPKKDRLVRDPVTMRKIPDEGIEVDEFNLYWARRLLAGDVEKAAPAATEPATAQHEEAAAAPAQETPSDEARSK